MYGLESFEAKQPFATRFFTQALNASQLVNSYLLLGNDMDTMMAMILRLAQIINCQEPPSPISACGQCQPCRWIGQHTHPGVIALSNLTFLPQDKSNKRSHPKSIVIEQLNALLGELSHHSGGFHRVVILAGAEESTEPPQGPESLELIPQEWRQSHEQPLNWLPLNRRVFPERLANKFLKTLEEPPKDVVFFLLTNAEEKLLDTIVSRCQRVPFQTPVDKFNPKPLSTEAQGVYQAFLGNTDPTQITNHVQHLTQYADDNALPMAQILGDFEHLLWHQLHHHAGDHAHFTHIRHTLKAVAHASHMLQARVKEEAVLEDLCLSLQTQH